MVQNFVFKETIKTKAELYPFMCKLLEDNGWIEASKGRVADNQVYTSKGVDGKSNIIFQMQPYYNTDKTTDIRTSTGSFIGVRPLNSYTPNANLTSAGTALPVKEMQWWHTFPPTVYPETKIRVAYHCNADHLFIIVTLPNFGVGATIQGRSVIFAVGKFEQYIETNEYSDTTTFCTPSYRSDVCRVASLPDYNHTTSYDLSIYSLLNAGIPRNKSIGGMYHGTEISFTSSVLGVYNKLPNVIALNASLMPNFNPDTYKDTMRDGDGYTWRPCGSYLATGTNYYNYGYSYFAYRIG